jgi:hypothetical protein
VKSIIPKLTVSAAVVAAVTSLNSPPAQASTYGDAPWCAVVNEGAGNPVWECEYVSVADCEPYVTAGNRGFCVQNPYWQPPASAPATVYHRWHRKHHARN